MERPLWHHHDAVGQWKISDFAAIPVHLLPVLVGKAVWPQRATGKGTHNRSTRCNASLTASETLTIIRWVRVLVFTHVYFRLVAQILGSPLKQQVLEPKKNKFYNYILRPQVTKSNSGVTQRLATIIALRINSRKMKFRVFRFKIVATSAAHPLLAVAANVRLDESS